MTQETQSVKEIILKTRERVEAQVNEFFLERKKIESMYDSYFEEISKKSNDFRLVKNVKTYSQNVYYTHPNSRQTIVDKVTTEYNECGIIFCGAIPEGQRVSIDISVCEHIKYGRRSWRGISQGYKLRLSLNYESEKYYKSASYFVKVIKDYVQKLWDQHNYEIEKKQKQELAKVVAEQKFDGKVYTYPEYILVKYDNKVTIKFNYYVDLETKEVMFVFGSIDMRDFAKEKDKEFIINAANTIGSF
jgi:hypothetical protein